MMDLTLIAVFAIGLIVAVITLTILPWAEANVDEKRFRKALSIICMAVEAAEQIFKGSGRGAEKKDYVLKILELNGCSLDMEVVDVAIESAVYQLQNKVKEMMG